jgi:hypothetical protein
MPDLIVSGNVDTMLGAADNAGIRTAIGLGQTDAPTFLAQSLTGQSLTVSQSTNLLNLATTWDTTGNPSLIYGRVTNNNSGPTSNLIDLGTFTGGSLFSVDKTGAIKTSSVSSVSTFQSLTLTGKGGSNLLFDTGVLYTNSSLVLDATSLYLAFNRDTILQRDGAAGILAQRNGTAKQALRVYNTALSGAPEWAEFDWITSGTGNTLKIGTNKSGDGVARPIDFVTGGVVQMSITAAGNVGIGATSATSKLQVYLNPANTYTTETVKFGNIHFGNGTGDYSNIWIGSIATPLTLSASNYTLANNGTNTIINGGSGGLFFHVSASAKWSIPSSGHFLASSDDVNDIGLVNGQRPRNIYASKDVISRPSASIIPANNGQFLVEATNNTTLTLKLKGTDGTVRSVSLTLV